ADRGRHQDVGVDVEPAVARALLVLGTERLAIDLAKRAARREELLDIESIGIGDRAVDVDHSHDLGAVSREITRAGSAHRAESLHDGAHALHVPALVLGARRSSFRDAIAADDVGQPDAFDLDGESLDHAAPPARCRPPPRALDPPCEPTPSPPPRTPFPPPPVRRAPAAAASATP